MLPTHPGKHNADSQLLRRLSASISYADRRGKWPPINRSGASGELARALVDLALDLLELLLDVLARSLDVLPRPLLDRVRLCFRPVGTVLRRAGAQVVFHLRVLG